MADEVPKARILIVDDEPKMTAATASALRRSGHACLEALDAEQASRLFAEHGADLVITDRRMPGRDGIELLGELVEKDPELPVVVVTAYGDVRSAVAAMKKGAFDYLTKPFDFDELRAVAARALEMRFLRGENRRLRRSLAESRGGKVIGGSEKMRAVLGLVDRAAASRATLLIQGESGTGKEVVARRVHAMSPRSEAPFIAVNCKAFGAGVLESELFGHEEGAFTGAEKARAGCFERAHGGTLFLDEIGEVDVAFQAKILRALQEGEVLRVGGNEPLEVDVRVIAATNKNLRAAIEDGSFREDLYYRLAVIPVHLPPLAERKSDIWDLAQHFLSQAAGGVGNPSKLSPEARVALEDHSWPGNVRELQNVIERAVVLSPSEVIGVEDLLLEIPRSGDPGLEAEAETAAESDTGTLQETLDGAARARIEAALDRYEGRRVDAARELGVDRTTLFRWMKRLGL